MIGDHADAFAHAGPLPAPRHVDLPVRLGEFRDHGVGIFDDQAMAAVPCGQPLRAPRWRLSYRAHPNRRLSREGSEPLGSSHVNHRIGHQDVWKHSVESRQQHLGFFHRADVGEAKAQQVTTP